MAGQITTTVQNQVASLYVSLLGRNPDSTGFGFWTNTLANAGDTLQAQNAIAIGFSGSPEFISVYGGQTTAQAVNLMYTNILGRAPDAGGAAYWTSVANNLIANGTPVGQAYALTGYQLIWTAANNGSSDSAAVNTKIAAAVTQGSIPGVTTTLTFGGTSPTFTTGTAVPAGALTLNDNASGAAVAVTTAMPAGATVLASQLTVNTAGTDTLTTNVSTAPWASVTNLTANTGGAATLTASALQNVTSNSTAGGVTVVGGNAVTVTAVGGAVTVGGVVGTTASPAGAITVTQSTAGANAVAVDGGTSVTVSQTGATTGTITVGANLAATGAVTVNSSTANTANGTSGAIGVTGGTAISITENLAASATTAAAVAANPAQATVTVTGGVITATGNASTTSVTVNQTNTTTAAQYVAPVAGVINNGGTAASPGTNAVPAATGVTYVKGTAGAVGVVDGQVVIADANGSSTTVANTITTVSLNGYGVTSSITDSALTTLNLAGKAINGSTLTITDNLAAHTAGSTSLALNTNAFSTTGTLVDAKVGILNLVNSGTTSLGVTGLTAQGTITTLNGTVAGTTSITAETAATAAAVTAGTISAATKTAVDTQFAVGATGDVAIAGSVTAAAALVNATVLVGNTAFVDTNLTTLNVSGSGVVTFPVTNNSALTAINITGAAGFNDGSAGTAAYGVAAFGAALAITTTSSGAVTLTLDDTTQTFVGSSGVDKIYVAGDATKVITGGTSGTDELVLTATGAGSYTLANTGTKVTGFEVLGLQGSVNNGVINMANFASGFNALDVISTGTVAVSNLAQNSSINFAANDTSLTVAYADQSGSTDSVAVTIGSATNSSAITIGTLALADSQAHGIGTLSFVSNNVTPTSNANTSGANIITTLTDAGLSVLNVSGSGGLTVTNALTTSASSFTVNNTETNTAPVTLGGLSDAGLTTLTFTGTNATVISTLTDATSTVLTMSNTGTGTATVGAFTATAIANLTLTGNVALTATGDAVTTGITVSGSTDNAHVSYAISGGAVAGATDSISLGNANNSISDASTAGHVNITVGTGSNLIDLHTGSASTYLATIALGAHTSTGPDSMLVGKVAAAAVTANTVVTGAVAGDLIKFVDNGTTVTTLTTAQLAATAAQNSLALAIAYVDGTGATGTALQAHNAVAFGYGGNTYILESAGTGNGTLTANDSLIQLVGTHTLSTTVTAGHVFALAS